MCTIVCVCYICRCIDCRLKASIDDMKDDKEQKEDTDMAPVTSATPPPASVASTATNQAVCARGMQAMASRA
jgi:hypothetical protein